MHGVGWTLLALTDVLLLIILTGGCKQRLFKTIHGSERVSMGLSVWRETSKKLTVCREKGKKLTVCRELFLFR